MKKVFLLAFLIGLIYNVKAANEQFVDGPITLSTSAILNVQDAQYVNMASSPSWVNDFTNYEVNNYVKIGYIPDQFPTTTSYIDVDLVIKYFTYNSNTFVLNTEYRTLSLSYDANSQNTVVDLSAFSFNGAHKIKVGVLSISGTGSPSDVFIEAGIEVERYYTMPNYLVGSSWINYSGPSNENLLFSWDYVVGAEEYELEWVYISDHDYDIVNNLPLTVPESDLVIDFYKNSTRVIVKENYYEIPAIFNRGYVCFRVRPIGRQGIDFEYRLEGDWNLNESQSVAFVPTTSKLYISGDFQQGKNWSHQISYTEDGKRFEGISYADGLGRVRQSLSHNNETDQVLISNLYFDDAGRAIISDLPSPESSESFAFRPNYNKLDGAINISPSSIAAATYNALDPCLQIPMKLDINYGSGLYYSATNTDVDEENAFIPDAEGYGYSQVKYLNDPTGRIAEIGAYGEAHQIGKNTTKIYYSTPTQEELTDLFGTEVGYKQHYQKEYAVDPNGQASMTYYDMSGNVIASSLVGSSPLNLEALPNNVPATPVPVVKYDGSVTPNGDIYPEAEISSYTYNLTIIDDQNITLDHEFDPSVFTDQCLPAGFCFDCEYEFTLEVNDVLCPENNPVYSYTTTINGVAIDNICNGSGYPGTQGQLSLSAGSYTVSKVLKVNTDRALDYWCNYVENNDCINTYADFYNDIYDNTDFNCTPLQVQLPTGLCDSKRDIMAMQMAIGGQYGSIDTQDPNYATSVYNESNVLPTGGTWRNPIFPYTNSNGDEARVYLSWGYQLVTNPTPVIVPNNGDPYTYPEYLLNFSDFVSMAQPSWGQSLVDYHPEICYLTYCELNGDYHSYTDAMLNTTTFTDACANGLFNPLDLQPPVSNISLFTTYSCDFTSTSNAYDDYFISGYYTTIEQWAEANYSCFPVMTYDNTDDLVMYYEVPDGAGTSWLTIWEYAIWQASCSGYSEYSDIIGCVNSANPDRCNMDLVWQYFRDAYMELRQKAYLFGQDAYVIYPSDLAGGGCGQTGQQSPFGLYNNECIGNSTFSGFNLTSECLDPYKHYNGAVVTTVYADANGPCSSSTAQYYDGLTPVFFNGSNPEPAPSNMTTYLNSQMTSMCQTNCEAQADDWMAQLTGCGITPGSPDYNAIKAGFIQVCTDGCDWNNPMGSSTAPGSTGYTSFEAVLIDILGSSYQNYVCSEFLISQPMPYDQNVQQLALGTLDDCGCDLILSAEYELTNNPVPGITTVQEMLMYLEGIDFAEADQLACLCNRVYGDNPSWDPQSINWSSQALQSLTDASYPVPQELTCSGNNCFTCSEVDAVYQDFLTEFGTGVVNATNYELLLENYMNQNLGIYISADQYINFMTACNSTSSNPNCALTTVAPVFKDMLTVIAGKGQLLTPQSTPIDLTTENIVYQVSNISTLFDGDNYWTCMNSCSPGTLTMYFGDPLGSPLSVTLTLPTNADFDFDDIIGIDWMSAQENCNGDDILDVSVQVIICGQIQTRDITMDSQIDLMECYCGSTTGLSLCQNNDFFIAGNSCYLPTIYEIADNSGDLYTDYIDDVRTDFIEDYIAQCAVGLESETLTETSAETSYQKTLFYYDQAGNLISTIAPKGFDEAYTSSNPIGNLNSLIADIPNHTFVTKYAYNSYNQLIQTSNPDQEGVTKFWYDRYGRIVASQNPVQADIDQYSFTFYDELGRPLIVGQTQTTVPLTDLITKADDLGTAFETWANNGTQTELTVTIYDAPLSPYYETLFSNGEQENLRLRVASVFYFLVEGPFDSYESANHYSYDEHGNVKEFIQDVPMLDPVDQQFKNTLYKYELLSGNVLEVMYQKDSPDYMVHTYEYDNLNRLVDVNTSIDDVHYSLEEHYSYYDYGPLARKEKGEHRVQGSDFAYTVNGWLKSMNSSLLDVNVDMGRDGINGYSTTNTTVNSNVARDVVAYSIGYYNGDYKAHSGQTPELYYAGSTFDSQGREQFNGNIRNTITSIDNLPTLANAYRYDQLYRLKSMDAFYESAGVLTATTDYYNSYEYDQNGNIMNLVRRSTGTNNDMDNMTYELQLLGSAESNRLDRVVDAGLDNMTDDIQPGMQVGNYKYDKIGQLIQDNSEAISNIEWRYGDKKVKIYKRNDANSPNVEFKYNPFGQRILKIERKRTNYVEDQTDNWIYTYYSYDANGQVMATYEVILGTAILKATLEEQHIYGSSRVGIRTRDEVLYNNGTITPVVTDVYSNVLGEKQYELTNHLGNVNAVITDRKMVAQVGSAWQFEAVVIMSADYYPGGQVMPGRSTNSDSYRYAYNGMEQDIEVSGIGNSYTTEYRQYDPRLMRWKSLDPLMRQFPSISPYAAFNNNPIYYIDPYGLASEGGPGKRKQAKADAEEAIGVYIDGEDVKGKVRYSINDDNSVSYRYRTNDGKRVRGKIESAVTAKGKKDYRTSGDADRAFEGASSGSNEHKVSYKDMVNQFEQAKFVVDKVVDPRISGADGVGTLIMAFANVASSGGDLSDIPPMDLIPVPGASLIGSELNRKWDNEMFEFEMDRAASSWKDMKKFASKRNTDASTVVVFVYAAMDVHEETFEMLSQKVPTTVIYNSAEEAKAALGFVPKVVYYKFITPTTNNLMVLPMNKLKF